MLDQVLALFGIVPDYDLGVMTAGQDLFDVTARVLLGLREVLRRERPHLVLVHGDTSTTLAAALAAFYEQIPVGHVEAGLRTQDRLRPFPEEMNRRVVAVLADYHFAPTPWARENLIAEGVPRDRIWVTGNTVIDALKLVAAQVAQEEAFWRDYLARNWGVTPEGGCLILVTGHRRENWDGLEDLCLALRDVAEHCPGVHLVFPVHLNPRVQQVVWTVFRPPRQAGHNGALVLETAAGSRLTLLPPLDYAPFVYLLSRCHLVLTDSGGLQEEAPALGKPVLVLREVTERPEGLWAGAVKLVGTRREQIFRAVRELLENPASYRAMAQAGNPFGDGQAAARLVRILDSLLQEKPPWAAASALGKKATRAATAAKPLGYFPRFLQGLSR